jgi:hypothetical protein
MNRRERRAAAKKSEVVSGSAAKLAALCESAHVHLRAERYLDAQLCCRQALEIDSGCASAQHLMGLVSLHAGQLDLAVEWMIRAEIVDPTAHLTDFVETAALISCLDLVITVDTSVAHLAGALGRPTWILLPYTPDYRWLLNREDSPWYPSVRLFRQTESRDYANVIQRVRSELIARIAVSPALRE